MPLTFWQRTQLGDNVLRMAGRRSACWLWTGALNGEGYPYSITITSIRQSPFRHAYRALVGPIETGLTLDHLCRVRHCVNPSHGEAVTNVENVQRAKRALTHCPRSHPYTPENTWKNNRGARVCRTCNGEKSRARWFEMEKPRLQAERAAAIDAWLAGIIDNE